MEAFPNNRICMTFQLTFHCWDHQRWRPIQIPTWLACWPLQLGSPQTQTGEWRTSTGRHCCCLLWFPWWPNREGGKGRGGGVKDVLHWVQMLCHWSEHISVWHAACTLTHQARVDHIEVISTEEDPGIWGEALPITRNGGGYKWQDTNVSNSSLTA